MCAYPVLHRSDHLGGVARFFFRRALVEAHAETCFRICRYLFINFGKCYLPAERWLLIRCSTCAHHKRTNQVRFMPRSRVMHWWPTDVYICRSLSERQPPIDDYVKHHWLSGCVDERKEPGGRHCHWLISDVNTDTTIKPWEQQYQVVRHYTWKRIQWRWT